VTVVGEQLRESGRASMVLRNRVWAGSTSALAGFVIEDRDERQRDADREDCERSVTSMRVR
jgi:hypothetical protein